MERILKFRAWDKYNLIMSKGYDLSDFLNYSADWFGARIKFEQENHNNYAPFSDCEVMQFTGLHDKNGKEIYESDIVENDNGQKYVVEWIEQIGGFYFNIPNTHRGKEVISCAASKVGNDPMMLYKEEVIGNIYETPSLIK